MKRLAVIVLLAIAAALPAFGDDVPFAEPQLSTGDGDANSASLGDIMMGIQLRHIKLGAAIKAKNWDILDFESTRIKDSFTKAAMLYRNIPVENISNAVKPLIALSEAIKAKDEAKVERHFAALTDACNACHQVAGVGFIVIKAPTASPFSDQKFAPAQK